MQQRLWRGTIKAAKRIFIFRVENIVDLCYTETYKSMGIIVRKFRQILVQIIVRILPSSENGITGEKR